MYKHTSETDLSFLNFSLFFTKYMYFYKNWYFTLFKDTFYNNYKHKEIFIIQDFKGRYISVKLYSLYFNEDF